MIHSCDHFVVYNNNLLRLSVISLQFITLRSDSHRLFKREVKSFYLGSNYVTCFLGNVESFTFFCHEDCWQKNDNIIK